jgi:hypothetical protein
VEIEFFRFHPNKKNVNATLFFSASLIFYYKNMKAVITGASGLLGRAVTKQFQNAGWEGKSSLFFGDCSN